MISENCDFQEFVNAVKGKDLVDIITLTDREATGAQRLRYLAPDAMARPHATCEQYANQLKGLIVFLRHGVKKSCIKDQDLEPFAEHCGKTPKFTM